MKPVPPITSTVGRCFGGNNRPRFADRFRWFKGGTAHDPFTFGDYIGAELPVQTRVGLRIDRRVVAIQQRATLSSNGLDDGAFLECRQPSKTNCALRQYPVAAPH
jgi:hypothetical protein